jgi:indole-3-glycerol phosphate synthase
MSFICEIKKASPSKGVIAADFPYLKIAEEYEAAGASAISVLTEPYYFMGDDKYLAEISQAVSLPLIRKDFTVDPYMIYEAKLLGASAILLICALLDTAALEEYINIAHSLGLSALVEAHTETEVGSALNAGARVIGVNNRDLKTFAVDIAVSEKLSRLIPAGKIFVSESGIKAPDDIARLQKAGAKAVLIGETFMRSDDKKAELNRLRGALS